MDLVWILTILTNIIVAGMGWALKALYSEQRELRRVMQATREDYVQKNDLKQLKDELNSRFDKLENILYRLPKD